MSGSFEIRITRRAKKEVDALAPKLREKLKSILLEVIAQNPYVGKKLLGDLQGSYSYRLNYKDRIIYSVNEAARVVYVERAKTHYGD